MDSPFSSTSPRPRPPAPRPRATIPGPFAFFRVLRGSAIEGLAVDHYEQLNVVTRTILGPVIVTSSPTALRHVLVTNAGNYPREKLQRRIISDGLGFGLLAAEGEQWRNQRRAIAPHFTPEKVAAFEATSMRVAAALVERWSGLGAGATVQLERDIPALAIDMLETALFPAGLGPEKAAYPGALKEYFTRAGRLGALDILTLTASLPRVASLQSRRSLATMRQVGDTTLARWRAAGTAATGILSRLFDPGKEKTGRLDETEIRDNVVTMVTAGFETSAGAMCWALYLLSTDPEWRDRVETEVDRELPDGAYVAGSLPRLQATRSVVEETLRLYPTVPVTVRQAASADSFDGLDIRPGTIVVVSPWVIHRHRRLWQEPDLFDPARFMPRAREGIDRFSYLPFGTGQRVCIGQGFAIQEMVIAIASIVRNFRLEPADDFSIWPTLRVTLQPEGNLAMRLRRRPG